LEDPEKVTVAFLVAVGAAESGRPTLMFPPSTNSKTWFSRTLPDVVVMRKASPAALTRLGQVAGKHVLCIEAHPQPVTPCRCNGGRLTPIRRHRLRLVRRHPVAARTAVRAT
jgi:hypothetical protein